jgi:citrate lyase subunit beta / citryl-CoA lyase
MPILETAQGIEAASDIAQASPRVRRLAFGAVDLALDMDLDLEDDTGPMAQARFALALASRRAGIEGPFDTAFGEIHALVGLRESSRRARAIGFVGKACIHPAQIDIINAVFTPSEAEILRARQIVIAFDAAVREGSAAISLDGLMIDYPVIEKARRTLRSAGAT